MTNETKPVVAVGLEEGRDGAVHVHALTLPGCVGTGGTREEALDAFAAELHAWLVLLGEQGERLPDPGREIEIAVNEWIATDADVTAGHSTVCFEADRAPLPETELLLGVRRLGALRGRLLARIRRMRDADLERHGEPAWNARIVLDQLARLQWWTLTRLGASPRAEVPGRVVARLDTAMALAVQQLTGFAAGADRASIELEGEEWTPRKVLRRLLWLEWSLGAATLHLLDREERNEH